MDRDKRFARRRAARTHRDGWLTRLRNRVRRLFRREPDLPGDPFAYVTAPRKPGPPNLRSSAVAEWPE